MTRLIALILLIFSAASCAVAPPGDAIFDPYEAQNREFHAFNKGVDTTFFVPIREISDQVPQEFTQPIANFADNVGLPGMVLNGLLQGDFEGATRNSARFVLNTTLGIGGLFDPAQELGLFEEETDFGETLAVWGAPEGAYLEVPLLGPSTERALAGRIVDSLIDPLKHVGLPQQNEYGSASRILGRVIKRLQYGDTVDSILYESADSYSQQRLIYLQNRRFELGTTIEEDAVDPYADLYGE